MTNWDLLLQKKKEKFLIENFHARKDYLWLTLYTLLKYCKINTSKLRNPD